MSKPSYKEIDLNKIKTYSIQNRKSKVQTSTFAKVHRQGASFSDFLDTLPDILIGHDFRELLLSIRSAIKNNKPIVIMMGAHVIKCGLNPLIIELMRRNIVRSIAFNGAGVIHDTETAYWGTTSEDVAGGLNDGSFGMVKETPEIINAGLCLGENEGLGYGQAVGKKISTDNAPHKNLSILANGYELNIPVTVHVAIGTDIIHQHGNTDGAIVGKLSHRDFKIFCQTLTEIGHGGILLNIGSAVILPEVFLKALTVVRNLGYDAHEIITANFDMLQHYRPRVNVVQRPTDTGGKGFQFTGHHEIMIPLLVAGILELL